MHTTLSARTSALGMEETPGLGRPAFARSCTRFTVALIGVLAALVGFSSSRWPDQPAGARTVGPVQILTSSRGA